MPTSEVQRVLLTYLVAVNVAAFLAFGWDKRAARRGSSRIPERRLLWLALLFGAPGAWFGARTSRHKTVKRSFRIKLALVTVLDAAVLGLAVAWWLTSGDR